MSEPWAKIDPATTAACTKSLHDGGYVACSDVHGAESHCEAIYDQMEKRCVDKDRFWPVQSSVCCREKKEGGGWECLDLNVNHASADCMYKHDHDDKAWMPYDCNCCCACFARGTVVATPDGHRAIETLTEGALVLAAHPSGEAPGGLVWEPTKVTFSSGTSQGTNHSMVYLAFHEGEQKPRDLICSADQVLMLADGKLTRASRLHRGDQLVTQDGAPVQIHTIAIGEYDGGVHHIGTAALNDLAGQHLIVAGGVVAGDYYLQLNFDSLGDEYKVADHAQRSDIWNSTYQEQHATGSGAQTRMVFGEQPAAVNGPTGLFTVYGTGDESYGDLSASLFTTEQAADVAKNGHQVPLGHTPSRARVEHIFRRLAGFYPDIEFYLDWARTEPNTYAVRTLGRKFVIVTGGLARLQELSYNGCFLAIAHAIGRFLETKPLGRDGFSGTGAADWNAFALVRSDFWFPGTAPNSMELYREYKTLLELIDSAHAGGDPDDPVNHPSVECRLECVSAAIFGGGVSACAGGNPPIPVSLEEAKATSATRIVLFLNETVSAESAAITDNYALTPHAQVTKAELVPQSLPCQIILTTQLDGAKTYSITIHGLKSSLYGADVDPEHDTAQFTSPG